MNKVNSLKSSIFLLTGFMCSGKSYIGNKISKLLNYDFIDLDSYIEFNEKKRIKDIFIQKGEEYFRSLETDYFKKIVNQRDKKLILAVGGGFPLKEENQLLMKKFTTIFIDTDFDTILSRLTKEEKEKRPLLANSNFIETKRLYEKRLPIYRKNANYIITDINEIIKIIYKKG